MTQRLKDSEAGFFVEETAPSASQTAPSLQIFPEDDDAEPLKCLDCQISFRTSKLHKQFSYPVCDFCYSDVKYPQLARTEAKTRYLLSDSQLDTLKAVTRKNPHRKFSEMRLYLEEQLRELALEIYGSEDGFNAVVDSKQARRDKIQAKRYASRLTNLRRAMRPPPTPKSALAHQHEFGEEKHDAEADLYSKSCVSCDHTICYEKM